MRPNGTRWCLLIAAAAAFTIGCGGSTTPGGTGGAGGVGAGGGSGVVLPGKRCSSSADCDGGLCDSVIKDCAQSGGAGVCGAALEPLMCMGGDDVCGCDGHVYPSPCDAVEAGTNYGVNGGCTTPPGRVPCGYTFCDPTTMYCEFDPTTYEPSYGCAPLPASCHGSADCACVAATRCGSKCKVVSEGGLDMVMVTCSK